MPSAADPHPRAHGTRRHRAARSTALALALLAGPAWTSAREESPLEPPAPRTVRVQLEDAAQGLARAGLDDELAELERILRRLGHPEDELAPAARGWRRELERATERKASSRTTRERARALEGLADDLREHADSLAAGLGGRRGPARAQLARLIVALDDQNPAASEVLGRVERDGVWRWPGDDQVRTGAARVRELTARARALEPRVQLAASDLPALADLAPGRGAVARAHGVEVHGTLEPRRLERVLTLVLRGAALSNALLGGELVVPAEARGQTFVLLDTAGLYRAAVDAARVTGGLDDAGHALQRRIPLGSFRDRRGWRTCDVAPDGDLAALLLWDLIDTWIGREAQPCLVAGHLNWLCGELYGVPMPATLWRAEPTSSARGDSSGSNAPLWRAAQRGTTAARLWAEFQLEHGRELPFERCLKDELGQVEGPLLVRATLAAAQFQELGTLGRVLADTARRKDRVAAFEEALGCELPAFDRTWERWLTGAGSGLVQRLEQAARAGEQARGDPDAAAFLAALARVRERALGPEVAAPEFSPELSIGAREHARYLELNADLRSSWEDLHLQRPERPGHGEAGARAGMVSMVHVGGAGEGPAASLEDWMATCLHRLPLLEPGLFGAGLGYGEGVVVADVSTLVEPPQREQWIPWPPPGAEDVPLFFVPEVPAPLRGADQAGLGYPVTLQVRRPRPEQALVLELELRRGGSEGPRVETHAVHLDPDGGPLLPPDTWCLVPTRPLEPRTRYSVVPRTPAVPAALESWSFTTGGR